MYCDVQIYQIQVISCVVLFDLLVGRGLVVQIERFSKSAKFTKM